MNDELLKPQETKPKSDKLVWLVAAIAAALLIGVGLTYFLTRSNSSQGSKNAAYANCPTANKQHPGHCISSNISDVTFKPGTAATYKYAILDDKNNPIKEYETVHEKQMHMIVVRKDLTNFQHVHPTLDTKTGEWTMNDLTFEEDGPYRIFADFTPGDAPKDAKGNKQPITIYEDITVGDMAKYKKQPTGDATEYKTFGNLEVLFQTEPTIISANASTKLSFLFGDAQKGGQAVGDFQPYLGAMGHAVVLSENLDFIHAHAIDDKTLASRGIINFMLTPPEAGKYKVFGQFQRNDKVVTADFVLPVYKSLAPADVRINSGDDVHSGH